MIRSELIKEIGITLEEFTAILPKVHHKEKLSDYYIKKICTAYNKPIPESIPEPVKVSKIETKVETSKKPVRPDWITIEQWLNFHTNCYNFPEIMAQKPKG
jgi:hypothetical protein